ncbi:PAS domain-containing protein [Amycolatopsis sp. NPDC051903]|uniref:PAS domain-containing protein n=1 Tax=Amycolatopsis sp. NPDC051903 TaxID=3363936 RepID=UPI0037A4DD5B
MQRETDDDPAVVTGEAGDVRGVFEEIPILLIGMAGPRHEVIAVNAAYRTTMGRDRLVGTSVYDAFPEVVGQHLFEMLDRVYATGVPQVARAWRFQYEREPGSGVLDEAYFDFTVSPRVDEHGTVVGLTCYSVDTTEQVLEQRRMQRQAAEAEQRYERARDVITALQ